MKRLEDIPKKNIFQVPDGYFEKLPGVIQARVAKPEKAVWFVPVLKYALPVLAVVVLGILWFSNPKGNSFDEQLASIQTEQLIAYLDDSDLNFDELTESVTWSETDLVELEETVFNSFDFAGDELDVLMDELIETENY